MFASQVSRPDIKYVVLSVNRFNANAGKAHWTAVKRIFRYLKGTIDKRLSFKRNVNGKLELIGYCDSDHGSDSTDRCSVNGYMFLLQGGAISWKSKKKQATVALTTTEAEYMMAMSSAGHEALWLRSIRNELFGEILPIRTNCDSKEAIHLMARFR